MDVLKRNLFKVSGIEKDAKLTEATSGPFSTRSIRYHLPPPKTKRQTIDYMNTFTQFRSNVIIINK